MTIDVSAKVLLFDDFESKLDLKKWWGSEWNPKDWKKHVYLKDGVLYLNQKKSGSDYVVLSSIQKFTECITIPVPKCHCQMRFTMTRAVSGWLASVSQRASSNRPLWFSGGRGGLTR